MPRGFVLQPTYRIESGQPIVCVFGTLESGEPFLIRDNRQTPSFHILQADATRARDMGAQVQPAETRQSMRGEPTVRVDLRTPSDAPHLRNRLQEAGIECFEADVRFAMRYLIDRGIRGTLNIEGPSKRVGDIEHVFENPDISPAAWDPKLSVLSFDIETNFTADRVLSISLHGAGAAEVMLLTPKGYSCPSTATPYRTERDLVAAFVERVRELDPDVITGWSVVDFDLSVLQRIAGRERVPFQLGRTREPMRIRPSSTPRGSGQASIPGRVVLDGIELLRGAFLRFDSYALNNVATEVLGKQKTITGDHRVDAIFEAFENDRELLVEYNLNDSVLVSEILEELNLMDLTVERSKLTGMPPDRVAASIASFDFLYLSELHRRGIVAPTVTNTDEIESQTGGHVLEPRPGLYPNVLVLDFKSLYPSVIRTFNIDPLGQREATELTSASHDKTHGQGDGNFIVAPNGATFAREPGVLPTMLDELFPRREQAKAAGDTVASHAIKILMNSFYGVLGTSACRFAAPALANAITGFGREILLWSKDQFEAKGLEVLYGDTDSLFVLSGCDSTEEARALGENLVSELNATLTEHVRNTWNVESKLELEFDRLYRKLLLPSMRGSTGGARKRYAGLADENGKTRLIFTGMESVRSDWTALAKQVQRELYRRLFDDEPVEEYLIDIVSRLRAGELEEHLVYRKRLRKSLDSYTASTPPHVAAARKLPGKPGRSIRYVITVAGAEPMEALVSPIDHEHYVQKQVKPIAEPVLGILHLDFDKVVGDDTQLDLF